MPDGFDSYFSDEGPGHNYERYIIEDTIGFVENELFPAPPKPGGQAVPGVSCDPVTVQAG
jgi:hypothetical protein